MKKFTILFIAILCTAVSFGQKREKIKGSKIVTLEQKEISAFENLEIEDNIEIFLIKGDKSGLEIDADDNLHSAINISQNGNTLRLTAAKEVSSFKKFSVKVTYTDDLKMIIAKHESNITALADLDLDNFTFKCFDYSKLFLNVKAKSFTLMANDKSKVELNLKSENVAIELSKNSHLKALIASTQMKLDMYQKASAVIEGTVTDLKLRMDNNADCTGKSLITKNAEIIAEGSSTCSVNITAKAVVEASGKSEIQFYGDAKIELKKFAENTVIMKKSLK